MINSILVVILWVGTMTVCSLLVSEHNKNEIELLNPENEPFPIKVELEKEGI